MNLRYMLRPFGSRKSAWKQHKKVYMKTMGKQTCMSACENTLFLFIVFLRVEGFVEIPGTFELIFQLHVMHVV